METLNKMIKKLSEEEYTALLQEVTDRKESKPYQVLEAARHFNYDDTEMMERLQVNNSTYYTLKSRLRTKIAAVLAKKVDNPISVLMDEVARVPALLYGQNREVSIRALKELEKQLLEYDLSNELIVVYKILAKLNLYNYDYDYYNKLYNKYVAYSLAVAKAENHFYDFIRRMGAFLMTREESELEAVQVIRRELANINELYDSHRLFVINQIVNLYFMVLVPNDIEALRAREIEVDEKLKAINDIFVKYNLDTFYQHNKYLVDLLYFLYYLRTRNLIRSDLHFKRIAQQVPELIQKHILNFSNIQFLLGKLEMYLLTNDATFLHILNEEIESNLEVDKDEIYSLTYLRLFQAHVKFYEGEYNKAARIMNDFRNEVSLRNYPHADVQSKLFQALQYSLMGDQELSNQIIGSVKRQIADQKDEKENVMTLVKFLVTANKVSDYKKKLAKLSALAKKFAEENEGTTALLQYVRLDEKLQKRLADPFK